MIEYDQHSACGSAVLIAADSDEFDARRRTYLGKRLHGKVATAALVGVSPSTVEACGRDGLCTVYVEQTTGRRLYVIEDVATAVALRKSAAMGGAAR